MSVWYCIPSARPPEEADKCLSKWLERGYQVMVWRELDKFVTCDYHQFNNSVYPGYARAVNQMIAAILRRKFDHDVEWFVTGGDDTDPDPNHAADEIASQCKAHFGGTFGVMQPTGDRFAYSKAQGSAPIDRVAGSPWMGLDWCKRINQGRGPLWPEYEHMFVDEELQNVAIKYSAFWQRPDLIHLHHHFQRESDAINSKAKNATPDIIPPHLKHWCSAEHWKEAKELFTRRKASGFEGSEPL
jgi:hypothetical protein